MCVYVEPLSSPGSVQLGVAELTGADPEAPLSVQFTKAATAVEVFVKGGGGKYVYF